MKSVGRGQAIGGAGGSVAFTIYAIATLHWAWIALGVVMLAVSAFLLKATKGD